MLTRFNNFAEIGQAIGTDYTAFFQVFLQVFFLNYQHVKIKTDGLYECHSSPQYELILPTSEEYSCFINHQHVKVKQGEFLLIQPFQLHQDILKKDFKYDCFHFFIKTNTDNQDFCQFFSMNTSPKQQIASLDSKVITQSKILWDELESNGLNSSTYPLLNALFQTIFELCTRNYSREVLNPVFSRNLKTQVIGIRLLNIFKENLYKQLSLKELCSAISMSKSSLSRHSQIIFQCGPIQAFMLFKIKQAKIILEQNPTISVKEISEKMGFVDQFHFSRIFKKTHGISPSKLTTKNDRVELSKLN